MATLLRRRRVETFVGLAGAVGLLAAAGCGGGGGGGGHSSSASTASNTTPGSTANGALSLGSGRALHTATLLKNGAIFVAGGVDSSGNAVSQTAIVTPTSVTFGPHLLQARVGHTATLLQNGEVLIAGGQASANATASLDTTEIYDPLANSIVKGPTLTSARSEALAVEFFGNNNADVVLVAGGSNGTTKLDSAEVLDVKGGVFAALPSKLAEPVTGASGARLDDGTIVLVGGDTTTGPAGAEVFDPMTGTFSAVNLTVRRSGGAFAATGREAIIAGGNSTTGAERSTETYDIATRLFSQGMLLQNARRDATASVTSLGLVIVGGRDASSALNSVEIMTGSSLATSSVARVTSLSTARYGHTATTVNGKVLVIGGFNGSGTALASIETIDPAKGTTPTTGTTVGVPGTGTGTTPTPLPPAPGGSGGGLGGILGGLLGGLTGGGSSGGIGGILGKVATAGIQTITSQGFSGGIGGFLKGFAGNLIAQFFPPGSLLGSIASAILPPTTSSTTSGSSGGIGSLLGSLLGGSSSGGSSSGGIGGVLGSVIGSIFGGGSGSSSTPAPTGATPTISSMTPSAGPVGTLVTITGDNLGTSVTVSFKKSQGFFSKILGFITGSSGTTSATIVSIAPGTTATQTVIACTVPSDADTGDVTVTAASGASASAGTFTVQ